MTLDHRDVSDAAEQPVSRRRAVVLGGAALAGTAGLLASNRVARAGADAHAEHDHHHGHDHHGHGAHDAHGRDSQHQALIDAALLCVSKGEACVPHCVGLLAGGDVSLGECLEKVLVTIPMCTAVSRAAGLDATRLKEIAKVCGDICADCEIVCRKHEKHHAVCKDCAEACAAFVKESKKLAG